MAGLTEVQLKNLENKLRNLENFSAKSVDESKASVYYTPTDYTLSPHSSPIHINYLNENRCNFSDIEGFKLNFEPNRLVGGGKILKNLDNSCTLNTYDEENSKQIDDDDDDDDDEDGAKAMKVNIFQDQSRSSALCDHHEYDKLLVNDFTVANRSEMLTSSANRRRKRYNNDYYYSVENVFDAKSLHNNHINIHQNHHHNHLCKDPSSADTLDIVDAVVVVVAVDDTGKTILTKNNCDNPLQTSTSLPEIQLNATTGEVRGRHVLLAIENTDNHNIQNGLMGDDDDNDNDDDVISEITKL